MKILKTRISMPLLIGLCITALLVGSAVASTAIFSNVLTHQFTFQPWTGTVAISAPSAVSNIGQSLTLTATLNPLPTVSQSQQAVTFYYSTMSGVTASSPIGVDPTTGWVLVSTALASTVTTLNGVAQLTMTPSLTGTVYFMAIVASPV